MRGVTVMTLQITNDHTGARIRQRRQQMKMSLREVAELAGISHTHLMRIEQGMHPMTNRFILAGLAQALKTSVVDLAGTVVPDGPDRVATLAGVYDTIDAVIGADLDFGPEPGEISPWGPLGQRLDALIDLRQKCEYSTLNRQAPQLLTDLYAATTGPDRDRALAAMVRVSEAASFAVRYCGDVRSATLASERAWQAAQYSGDPVMLAFGAWARAHSALGCGLHERAALIASKALSDLDAAAQQPGRLEMLGMLYLTQAFAYAGAGRHSDIEAPLTEADVLAAQTGETNTLALMFGPTNVAFWRIALATDGPRPDDAIPLIGATDPRRINSPSRQCCFYLDAGRTLARVGEPDRAVVMVETAHRIAPQRVAGDPIAVELVRGLVDGAKRRAVSPRLRGLAGRLGVSA